MKNDKNKDIIIGVLLIIIIALTIAIIVLVLNKNDNLNNNIEENNQVNDNINNENIETETSIKIDDNLDYVYDASYKYDNEYTEFNRQSYKDGNTQKISNFGIEVEFTIGMQYLSNLKVPYININTSDAAKANKELETLYLDYAKNFDKCAKEAIESELNPSCSQILTYKTYKYNDILSIVVINSTQTTSKWILDYNTYNFDLNTGKLLNYNDLLSKLGYNEDETLVKIKDLLKDKLQELHGSHVDDFTKACSEQSNCYDKANELLENSIKDNSILFFVNDKGNLNVLAIPYYDGVQNGEINKYLLEVNK